MEAFLIKRGWTHWTDNLVGPCNAAYGCKNLGRWTNSPFIKGQWCTQHASIAERIIPRARLN